MDLLENVATELGFQFHLYLVQDELYGSKYSTKANVHNTQSSVGVGESIGGSDGGGQMATGSNGFVEVEMESDWDQTNGIFPKDLPTHLTIAFSNFGLWPRCPASILML